MTNNPEAPPVILVCGNCGRATCWSRLYECGNRGDPQTVPINQGPRDDD